jgi:hypothetical protein
LKHDLRYLRGCYCHRPVRHLRVLIVSLMLPSHCRPKRIAGRIKREGGDEAVPILTFLKSECILPYAGLPISHQLIAICGAPTSSRSIQGVRWLRSGPMVGEGQSCTALTETCKEHLQGRHARSSRRCRRCLPQHCRLPSIKYPTVVPVQGPNTRYSPHRGTPASDHFPISKQIHASDTSPNSANVL